MPPKTYEITAPNGKTLSITGDHVPTESELHDIFLKAGVETGAMPSQTSAIDMLSGRNARYRGGAGLPEGDEPAPDWKANLAAALEPAAHPRSAGDLTALLIPSGGAAALGEVLSPIRDAVAKYGGATAEAAVGLLPARVRAALKVLKDLSPTEWNSPLTVAGREGRAVAASQEFNARPLAEQMKDLPSTGPTPQGRPQAPPPSNVVPFHERPLYQQMGDLPAVPAPEMPRPAGPPPITAPSLSDIDLARQEVAAGRLSPAVLRGLERNQALKAARTPIASPSTTSVSASPATEAPPTLDTAGPPAITAQPPVAAAAAMSPQQTLNELAIGARRAKIKLTGDEERAAVGMVQQGAAPPDAIKAVVEQRLAADPAAELAKRFGSPSDAEVQAALAARVARGEIKGPAYVPVLTPTRIAELQAKFGGRAR